MGTWGSGNFDSDGAMDYVDTLIRELIEEIEECFAMQGDSPEDFLAEFGECTVMPAIDIYITLSSTYRTFHVEADTAARWRQVYLRMIDEDTSVNPQDFKPRRRKAIVETFDRLDALIDSQRRGLD